MKGGEQETDAEERFLEAIAEEDEETDAYSVHDQFTTRHDKLQRKNQSSIDGFLRNGQRTDAVIIVPRYYGELLTWALHRYIEKEEWKVIRTLGYRKPEPVYIDVSTDYDKCENLLMDGQFLIEKDDLRFVATVDVNLRWRNSVRLEGSASRKQVMDRFVQGVGAIAREDNIYRGKKIEFAGRIRFLNLSARIWDSIILKPETKMEVKANTVDFLNKRELWVNYGIPTKRGVLLAGEPGTGKTAICKALLAEADKITCITTNAYALDADEYITELYELAQDLIPSLVFIEDIDLIGQNRVEFGYHKRSPLVSLLAIMDGIEEKKEVVTVATTNCLDVLDKAISERPARFDRVIKLSRLSLEQRKELLKRLSQRIPLDEATQEYIARKAADCTPAQLQEIAFSLVIEHSGDLPDIQPPCLKFSNDDIDSAISRINGKNRRHIGFGIENSHNGHKPDQIIDIGGRR